MMISTRILPVIVITIYILKNRRVLIKVEQNNSTSFRTQRSVRFRGMTDLKNISSKEVSTHTTVDSAWTIIDGKVYDVTEFLEEHPGGKKILLKNCGKDSTELFNQYHNEKILKEVGSPMIIGQVSIEAKL
uniref:Cytochrome b5 heme-binding domain-containing protein n=1 Tax=Phakopsora pachyrhizi TaxID=170000 RepID=A0A0S1MJB2_PHAPC